MREPDPEAPYAAVRGTPNDSLPSDEVKIDASECMDMNGNPCTSFVFDFGDGSPPVTSANPVVNHAYDSPGSYSVSVIAIDRNGKKANASSTQRVKDPKNPIGPPYAILQSKPRKAFPAIQSVKFDASKSGDYQRGPCKSFVWNFGDDTPKIKTKEAYIQHRYYKSGQYPVTVEVEDEYGAKSIATLSQRCVSFSY